MAEGVIPMMSNRERLIYMANQIGRNFAATGDEAVAEAVTDHIASFWDPRMKDQIAQVLREDPTALSVTVQAAVARLHDRGLLRSSPAIPSNAAQGGSPQDG